MSTTGRSRSLQNVRRSRSGHQRLTRQSITIHRVGSVSPSIAMPRALRVGEEPPSAATA
jgi:hypothetical protein